MLKSNFTSHIGWTRIGRAILPCLSLTALLAQDPTARVTGTVTDVSGAVVPGAAVTLTNMDTAAKKEGKTNENGIYSISSLSPGPYSFSVEAPSFRRYNRTLALVTGQVLQLDFKLELGSTTDTITVTTETPLVQSATSDVNHLVEQAFIQSMPLESGRSGALVRLLPGVTFINEETFEPQLNFSIAGGQARSGEYRLDGGNVTLNALLTRTIEFNPPIEATQEMKVEVNGYAAEFGHSTGGVFSITSKSGTNQYHGVVYENFRNSDMDARSFLPLRSLPASTTSSERKWMALFGRTRCFSCSRTKAREEWTAIPGCITSLHNKRCAAISPIRQQRSSIR